MCVGGGRQEAEEREEREEQETTEKQRGVSFQTQKMVSWVRGIQYPPSAVSLFWLSVNRGHLRSETVTWKIPEMNNS